MTRREKWLSTEKNDKLAHFYSTLCHKKHRHASVGWHPISFFSYLSKTNSSTVLTIGLLLALLIAPCAVHASDHGGGGAEAKKGDDSKKPKKKEDAATITGGMVKNEPVYLNLPAITMPVINKYGAQQIISMIMNIRVSDRDAAEEMQLNMPKLRDVLFQVLYTGFSDGSLRNDNAVDLAGVKAIVIQTVNGLYQKEYAVDVLIQAMAQRRL